MATGSRVIVYGGKGGLGSAVVSYFKGKNWVCMTSYDNIVTVFQWVGSIDLFANEEADVNILITETESWSKQSEQVDTHIHTCTYVYVCVYQWLGL